MKRQILSVSTKSAFNCNNFSLPSFLKSKYQLSCIQNPPIIFPFVKLFISYVSSLLCHLSTPLILKTLCTLKETFISLKHNDFISSLRMILFASTLIRRSQNPRSRKSSFSREVFPPQIAPTRQSVGTDPSSGAAAPHHFAPGRAAERGRSRPRPDNVLLSQRPRPITGRRLAAPRGATGHGSRHSKAWPPGGHRWPSAGWARRAPTAPGPKEGAPRRGHRRVPSGRGSHAEGRTRHPVRLRRGAGPLRGAASRGRAARRRPRGRGAATSGLPGRRRRWPLGQLPGPAGRPAGRRWEAPSGQKKGLRRRHANLQHGVPR